MAEFTNVSVFQSIRFKIKSELESGGFSGRDVGSSAAGFAGAQCVQ
jgi:hypothetical protein